VWVTVLTMSSPVPRAPAKIPVLESPSTSYVPVMSGPDAVGQAMLNSNRTNTPSSTTMRRVAAFVQLPGPQGVTERSCVIPTTTVAAPNPSTVPLPVLISWKVPRSAIRLVIDAAVYEKLASSRFAWFGGSAAACSASPLARAMSAMTRSGSRIAFFIVSHLLSSSHPPRTCVQTPSQMARLLGQPSWRALSVSSSPDTDQL
jgi:hypothetical protein